MQSISLTLPHKLVVHVLVVVLVVKPLLIARVAYLDSLLVLAVVVVVGLIVWYVIVRLVVVIVRVGISWELQEDVRVARVIVWSV